jgi:hypothetical protein
MPEKDKPLKRSMSKGHSSVKEIQPKHRAQRQFLIEDYAHDVFGPHFGEEWPGATVDYTPMVTASAEPLE